MKKKIYSAIYFVTLLLVMMLVLDWIFTAGIKKSNYAHYAKIKKVINNDNIPQIAIFSSSVGEMGFDSRVMQNITHKSVYNFSLRGTVYMQHKCLIDEMNDAKNDNEIVVLAETNFTFEKINSVFELEVYLPYLNNKNIYNCLYEIQPDLVAKSRYIPFYKYITVSDKYYKQSLFSWKWWLQNKTIPDTLLGQVAINEKWDSEEDNFWKNAKPIPIIIDSPVVNMYRNTVLNLVKKNKKVVIIIPPIYIPKGQKIVDLKPFRKILHSFADNKNVFYFDFSESMVDKQYFYNVMHLNAGGAKIFTKSFCDSLIANKIVQL